MIVDALFSIFNSVVNTVLGWLPDIAPPDVSGAIESMAPVWAFLGWANKYVPLVEAGAMIGLVAAVYMVMYLIRFTVWVLTKAHILGGS